MSDTTRMPELHLSLVHKIPKYVPPEDWRFDHDLWVPTLQNVLAASTYREQQDAVTEAVVSVGAYTRRLYARSRNGRNRIVYQGSLAEARLYAPSEGRPTRLAFLGVSLRAGMPLHMGYQTPDAQCPNAAFVVMDHSSGDRYAPMTHDVIRNPDEALSPIARYGSQIVVNALAGALHHEYPGFNIFGRLAEEAALSRQ